MHTSPEGRQRDVASGEPPGDARSPRRLALLALLCILPVALAGPGVLPGRRFLPQLPVSVEPLASEHPEAAALASQDANLSAADRLFPTLTDQLAAREMLSAGQLPLWDPDLGLGLPLFADSIAGLAYPPNWLGLLLPPELAAGPLALLGLFLAGLGAYLFLARVGLAPGACVIGALAMQSGGWGVANLFDPMKFDSALWLPFCLWAVEGLARRRPHAGAWLSLFIALSLLAGFPPIAIFGLASTCLFALLRLAPQGLARLSMGMLFLLLGVAGGGLKLLPMAECSAQSVRQERSFETSKGDALPTGALLGLVIPDLFGDPREPGSFGAQPTALWLSGQEGAEQALLANPLEWNTFAGIVTLLLSISALIARPRGALPPLLGLMLVLGYVHAWPLARLLYHVPGLDLGIPGRALSVAWWLWAWLAALGVDALLRRSPRAIGSLAVSSFALACAAFFAWTGLHPQAWASELEASLGRRHSYSIEEVRAVLDPAASLAAGERLVHSAAQVFASALAVLTAALMALTVGRGRSAFPAGAPAYKVCNAVAVVLLLAIAPRAASASHATLFTALLVLAGTAALCSLAWRGGRTTALAVWLPIGAALLAEGLFAAGPHLAPRPAGSGPLLPQSKALAAVAEAAGDGRVLRLDTSTSGVAQVERLAKPNLLHAYGIADLTPYQAFTLQPVQSLFRALDPRSLWRSGISRLPTLELVEHPVLDRARVTAILATTPLEHPALEPVLERPGFCVYRRSGSLKTARVVPTGEVVSDAEDLFARLASGADDPRESVLLPVGIEPGPGGGGGRVSEVSRPSPSRLDVVVEDSSGGWLVMQEAYYPGWRATVNGETAPIVRADGCFRAVRLPEGQRIEVSTRYAPSSHLLGLALSVLGLGGALLLSRRMATPPDA